VSSIARHCPASERGIRILCDFLTICGVLIKEDGRYRHTPASAAFLDPRSPSSLASIAQFLGNQAMREPYDHLAEIVRTGRTVLPGGGSVEPENPIWVQFAETMAPMMAPMVGPLGAVVLAGRTGPMRVLDIAAGHGLFGIEIAKQNPQARVTGLDWAPVLRVALANARKAGVHERYDMLPGGRRLYAQRTHGHVPPGRLRRRRGAPHSDEPPHRGHGTRLRRRSTLQWRSARGSG
jgi:hypothetical protein